MKSHEDNYIAPDTFEINLTQQRVLCSSEWDYEDGLYNGEDILKP